MATTGPGAPGGDDPAGAHGRPPAEPVRGARPSPDRGGSAGPGDEFRRGLEEALRRYTGRRCEEAGGLDGLFRARLAAEVARFTLHGGKRMRAAFLWWGWRAAGGRPGDGDEATALRLAGALELLQTCALVHDDLMDDSALRRGRPALHVELARRHRRDGMLGSPGAYGASMATLAGDLALAWADDMFAEALPEGPAGRRVREPWREMRTEMVAGQFLDLHTQAEGGFSAPAALRVAHLKSALYTVERPLQLGAALRGSASELVGALRFAGRRAGLAFQLRDDLLGDPRRTGKPAGDDVREGKNTYPAALALARAEALGDTEALAVLRGSLGDRTLTPRRLARYREVLTELGVRAAVERRIERLSTLALDRIDQACDDPAVRRGLAGLVRAAAGTRPP
ncbi:polyprenyl synthetase family protein [Streptomyces verrucosisporus]|uniref:polyprenyl synthetase family protein n=1 Tax=Streptomyces verrucosisporus TaxID=1695161 RepID=UPI0019D03577|nr:polyprenyl synthetase family protein [Streptomyces verrucosisporus]MBN3932250.1 polyprenyl synthetase family protein [Streptomyces verrucosisporus]